jgi:hypothetical protein
MDALCTVQECSVNLANKHQLAAVIQWQTAAYKKARIDAEKNAVEVKFGLWGLFDDN